MSLHNVSTRNQGTNCWSRPTSRTRPSRNGIRETGRKKLPERVGAKAKASRKAKSHFAGGEPRRSGECGAFLFQAIIGIAYKKGAYTGGIPVLQSLEGSWSGSRSRPWHLRCLPCPIILSTLSLERP